MSCNAICTLILTFEKNQKLLDEQFDDAKETVGKFNNMQKDVRW